MHVKEWEGAGLKIKYRIWNYKEDLYNKITSNYPKSVAYMLAALKYHCDQSSCKTAHFARVYVSGAEDAFNLHMIADYLAGQYINCLIGASIAFKIPSKTDAETTQEYAWDGIIEQRKNLLDAGFVDVTSLVYAKGEKDKLLFIYNNSMAADVLHTNDLADFINECNQQYNYHTENLFDSFKTTDRRFGMTDKNTKYAFGIDLGTTNSCIAVKTADKPASVITLADGSKTLPSCVMYKDGKIVVGRKAYDHRFDTKHVVYSSKRDIGSDKTYTVYANGDDVAPIEVTPVDVASEILKTLKHDAELLYGEGFIKDVTITVPAYFTLERRAATLQAAEMAGLNVVALINEPTAASLAYGGGTPDGEKILVYDLGGGTFDVTLLDMVDGTKKQSVQLASFLSDDLGEINDSSMHSATVIASAGNPRLGGDDIDYATYKFAIADANCEHSVLLGMPSLDIDEYIATDDREEIILGIERIKKGSTLTSTVFPVKIQLDADKPPVVINIKVTSEHYKNAVRSIYVSTQKIVNECLVGQNIEDISKIILIGGSTKLQMLRDMIRADYEHEARPISTELNPDEAVALGAAVNSAIMLGTVNMKVTDVLQQSIGIECISGFEKHQFGGRYVRILEKNTPLPASATFPLETSQEMQEEATVPIYQGEDSIVANNMHIGTIKARLEPSAESQTAYITLTVTPSGVLKAELSSHVDKVKVELENVLRPANTTMTGLTRMLNKYKALINNYRADETLHTKCLEVLDSYEEGKIDFKTFKHKVDDLTHSERSITAKDIAEESRVIHFAEESSEFDDDDDDES